LHSYYNQDLSCWFRRSRAIRDQK